MRYQVGDRIKVRDDLVLGMEYNGIVFTDGMLPTCGRYDVIEKVDFMESGIYILFNCSYINRQLGYWVFSNEMLEPADRFDITADEIMEFLNE